MNKNQPTAEEQIWYIFINEQTRGPISLRDLDVLLRTNQITSSSYGWRNGMKDWKALHQIEQIKQSILESSKEMLEIQKQKQTLLNERPAQQQKQNQNSQEDAMIENKDQNPLTILQVTVQNLLLKTFHQSKDGKWNIYDEEKGEWIIQDEQPIQQIAKMKNQLIHKLKAELFVDEKGKKKKNKQNQQQPIENLTKQELEKRQRNKKKTKRAAEKKKEKWYNAKINTFVYISGLPFDITETELKEFVSKAGVLRTDINTGEDKIKIYKDENNFPKGDAVVSFARQQSVSIAIDILNESQLRSGFKVKVERAQFNQKDEQYKKRQTKRSVKLKKILAKKNEDKMLAWDQQGEEKGDGFKIVIIKHIFSPQIVGEDSEIDSIKKEMTEQLKRIGQVKRIRFYQTHPDGIVEVKFEKDKDAQSCITIMNGRYFDGRQIQCEYWDGQTDYKRDAQSIMLQNQRLQKYGYQIQEKEEQQNEKSEEESLKNE